MTAMFVETNKTGVIKMVKRDLLTDDEIDNARKVIQCKNDEKYFIATFPFTNSQGDVVFIQSKQAKSKIPDNDY